MSEDGLRAQTIACEDEGSTCDVRRPNEAGHQTIHGTWEWGKCFEHELRTQEAWTRVDGG